MLDENVQQKTTDASEEPAVKASRARRSSASSSASKERASAGARKKPARRRSKPKTQTDVIRRAFPGAPASVKDKIVAGLLNADSHDLLAVPAAAGNAVILGAFHEWATEFAAEFQSDPRVRDNKVQTAVLKLAAERNFDADFLFYNPSGLPTLALLLREVCGNADIFVLQSRASDLT